jgi:hypothetical protein
MNGQIISYRIQHLLKIFESIYFSPNQKAHHFINTFDSILKDEDLSQEFQTISYKSIRIILESKARLFMKKGFLSFKQFQSLSPLWEQEDMDI